ncbi:MAG: glycyl-radical enzyme activating protein [Clostridiales bacterium]|nr:glycyl-radical enzyme activating protein [Clostridiales bacterium]
MVKITIWGRVLEKAVIFNVMRYSVHDGPGIRTTVFFKGCPLSCKWCHNPESFSQGPQQIFNPGKCIKCGHCAITDSGDNCPTGARETIGYEITVPELMREIKKDLLFYEQSGGGVTFSGGEPFSQSIFLLAVLEQCRNEYINTAIDTSGFCDSEAMLKAAEKTNYFLFDIKFIDCGKHEKYCGAPNDLILKNLRDLAEANTKLLIRIPVIPTINDDMREMTGIFEFIKGLKNIETVHLLPYHNLQTDKYKRIGIEYELSEISNDESPNMNEIINLFATKFRTKVGG